MPESSNAVLRPASTRPIDETSTQTPPNDGFAEISLANNSAPDRPCKAPPRIQKWSFGVLNDKRTEQVPGTVLLLASTNEPLGVRRQSGTVKSERRQSTMPPQDFELTPIGKPAQEKKRTPSGTIILDPQPDDSPNDPLNWSTWRRDAALFSLGFYCMVAGGLTPILAAGFYEVATTYDVSFSKVALTTGLYMMGLGIGGVFMSPTAILFGKRPVYLISSIVCILTSIWCAASPSFASLATARVFQGISASPVECLPSATIAEIFFLHERAYRVGIYGLLLLGGKNLVPLISAIIIQACGWRWVFWIVAMVVALCSIMLFFFAPETFWDRTPRPASRTQVSLLRRWSTYKSSDPRSPNQQNIWSSWGQKSPEDEKPLEAQDVEKDRVPEPPSHEPNTEDTEISHQPSRARQLKFKPSGIKLPAGEVAAGPPEDEHGRLPHLHNLNSPYYSDLEKRDTYFLQKTQTAASKASTVVPRTDGSESPQGRGNQPEVENTDDAFPKPMRYTTKLMHGPRKRYGATLKPWNGRLSNANWTLVALRPFILYAYPSVLWSTLVYSISVGWLIVLSESVAHIYANPDTYGFTPLQCGLVYISPFIGGILGTAIAGKGSDIIVRYMARRNNGVYEPEFRLVMALPIALATAVGLMGFGWSAEEGDGWIVPTVFFAIISFGCSLGATTAITFCVDSYRQFAGEALVTLNFSKNIFHGLAFSLFFPGWLQRRGSKEVFVVLGVVELLCLVSAIPMYLFGKRARMWTVRKNMMDRF